MKNILYLKLGNLKKEDLFLIEYLCSQKKVCWIKTPKQLNEVIRK